MKTRLNAAPAVKGLRCVSNQCRIKIFCHWVCTECGVGRGVCAGCQPDYQPHRHSCAYWSAHTVLAVTASRSRGLLYLFYPKQSTFWTWRWLRAMSTTRSEKKCPWLFQDCAEMSWAYGHILAMVLILKNIFSTWLFECLRYDLSKKCPTILYRVNLWPKLLAVNTVSALCRATLIHLLPKVNSDRHGEGTSSRFLNSQSCVHEVHGVCTATGAAPPIDPW